MYIEKLKFRNYGPLKNVEIKAKFDADGNPVPLIIIGENGAGKTLFLSNIVDSFIELKKQQYSMIKEISHGKRFKIGSKDYIKANEKYSQVQIDYKNNDAILSYQEVNTKLNYEEFVSQCQSELGEAISDAYFVKSGFYKNFVNAEQHANIFDKNILLYFPFSRYEKPAWLSEEAKIGFSWEPQYIETSNQSLIKENVIEETERWILDLLLDQALYENKTISINDFVSDEIAKQLPSQTLLLGKHGKNSSVLMLIRTALSLIYGKKFKDLEYARFGVSPKNQRKISLIIKNIHDSVEETIAPSFSHISSGEAMLLSLFCTILKEFDSITFTETIDISEAKGIVVIDEIDLHLHVNFQKEVLPILLKLFPKVQFIVTTHSPMFLIGLENHLSNGMHIVNLPIGNEVAISDFSEFNACYDAFIQKNMQYKAAYEWISQEFKNLSNPLLITEGKTDWKHLKNALNKLQELGEYSHLSIAFFEYDFDMGDTTLVSMCEHYSKTPRQNKIIFMFDRDNPKIVSQISNGSVFKYWGNNVYSFCIPVPSHRQGYCNISIEFYYTDTEIKSEFEGKRLHFSNEISEIIHKNPTTNHTTIEKQVLSQPQNADEYAKKIYDQDADKIVNTNQEVVGLSKTIFAHNVYNQVDGFNNFEVNEFKKIFDILVTISQNNQT